MMPTPPTQPTVTSETGLAASEQTQLPTIDDPGLLTHMFGVSNNIPSHLSVYLCDPASAPCIHACILTQKELIVQYGET